MFFPFDSKITQNTRKIISVHIFTLNHFWTELQTRRERERERERESERDRSTRSTGKIAPIVAVGSSSALPSKSSPPKTNPPKTDLVLDPPKTKLVRRAMPKAPVGCPLQLRCPLHSRNLEIQKTQKTHSSNPLRRTHHSDEPIPQTHFSNPHWPLPISLSLSLKSLSNASLLF